jgi:sporulation protein YlmC with PRC-barrel domain
MKPDGSIKLVGQLLDLPIIDKDGNYSGVVDDIEFEGGAGKPMRVAALLVGPGAYAGRLPKWAMWLVSKIAGDRITRVPLDKVAAIDSAVHLKGSADRLGLHKSEDAARAWIPRKGAM